MKNNKMNLKLSRKHFGILMMIMVTVIFLSYALPVMPVLAGDSSDVADATNKAEQVISNMNDFIFTVLRLVGIALAAWGVFQFGVSFNSHDASQRAQGLLSLAGGIVVVMAKEILQLIGVIE